MAGIRPNPSSLSNLKIRIPLDLLNIENTSILKSLNQQSIRLQKVYPVFIHLLQADQGFEFAENRQKKTKTKPKPSEDSYKCDIDSCNKEFSDPLSLRKHQSIHNDRQYLCPVENCGRQFLDNSKLRRHMLVHTGEKPFRCEFCSKCFSLDFNLKTHLRIHTGEKPYQCSFAGCMKRFTQSSNLTAHERTHYMTEDEIKTRASRPVETENFEVVKNRQPFSLDPMPAFDYFNPSSLMFSASGLPSVAEFISTSALPSEN